MSVTDNKYVSKACWLCSLKAAGAFLTAVRPTVKKALYASPTHEVL